MAAQRMLDLTTDQTRPVIAIDAVDYPLRAGDDLTFDQYKFLERVSPRLDVLLQADELDAKAGAELSTRLREITAFVLVAPPDVLAKLKDLQRLMIVRTFTALSTPTMLAAARALETSGQLSGMKPSRGSSGATAGPRKPGSRKPR